MNFFTKKPTVKEQTKTTKKIVRKEQRNIDREFRDLERQEKEMMAQIKKRSKESSCSGANDRTLIVLSKQLIQIRQAKEVRCC